MIRVGEVVHLSSLPSGGTGGSDHRGVAPAEAQPERESPESGRDRGFGAFTGSGEGFQGRRMAYRGGGLDAASRFVGPRRGGVTERYYMLPGLVDVSAILQRRWEAGAKQK